MGLHRGLADDQVVGELAVGAAPSEADEDLPLPGAEGPDSCGHGAGRRGARRLERHPPLDQPAGDRRIDEGVAGGDGAYGGDEHVGADVLQQEPGGAGPERAEHVLVVVEGGEDEHGRR